MTYRMAILDDGTIAVFINGALARTFASVPEARAYLEAGAPGARIWTPDLLIIVGCGLLFAAAVLALAW